jgi:alpha-1,6-mannosyltransferase
MKFCDITSFYMDRGGGVRTYHRSKLKYFASRPEHEYILLVGGKKNAMEIVPGGRIYYVRGFPVGWNGYYRQIGDLREVRRIITHERPDVIESGSPYADGWITLFGRGDTGAKTVGFYHADVPDSYIAPAVEGLPKVIGNAAVRFWRFYTWLSYNRFDATLVTSRYIEEKLTKLGLHSTHRIPLGVDTDLFTPKKRSERLRRDLGAAPEDKILLFAGRFRKEKGIQTLVKAVRALDGRPGIKFVLVGDGPHDSEVRSGLARSTFVKLMGYVEDQEELASIYASSDIFLSPGAYETFGLSSLEAMSSGLPVIGADSGGTGETVAASGAGRLFRSHDADDLVRCIEAMLEQDLDAQRRQVRAFVKETFRWSDTFDQMEQFYQSLCPLAKAG